MIPTILQTRKVTIISAWISSRDSEFVKREYSRTSRAVFIQILDWESASVMEENIGLFISRSVQKNAVLANIAKSKDTCPNLTVFSESRL